MNVTTSPVFTVPLMTTRVQWKAWYSKHTYGAVCTSSLLAAVQMCVRTHVNVVMFYRSLQPHVLYEDQPEM